MQHTFLFQEAIWQATGRYINQNGNSVEVQGKSTITHRSGFWRNDYLMQLMPETPEDYRTLEYSHCYQIKPFQEEKDTTTWTASTSGIGKLEGQFTIVDDTILSLFHTRIGNGSGMEYCRMINNSQYQNKGAFFEGNQKVSSWTINFQRQLTAL